MKYTKSILSSKHYILYRASSAVVVIGLVSTLVFFLARIIPGDPIEAMLGEQLIAADREALIAFYGLDQPLFLQWIKYLTNIMQGNMGYSIYEQIPVTKLVFERLPSTLMLSVTAMIFALLISIPLGIMAALHRGGKADAVGSTFSTVALAIPSFWLAPMLILMFAYHLDWFPISGQEERGAWVLPSLSLGIGLAALQIKMIRSTLIETLQEDYVTAARARGIFGIALIARYAILNAMLPLISILGLQLAALLSGALITETIFDWPGIGLLTIEAIEKRDYPLLQGCVLVISIIYVLANLAIDALYPIFDPRVKLG